MFKWAFKRRGALTNAPARVGYIQLLVDDWRGGFQVPYSARLEGVFAQKQPG
jgi:hypothetical protein